MKCFARGVDRNGVLGGPLIDGRTWSDISGDVGNPKHEPNGILGAGFGIFHLVEVAGFFIVDRRPKKMGQVLIRARDELFCPAYFSGSLRGKIRLEASFLQCAARSFGQIEICRHYAISPLFRNMASMARSIITSASGLVASSRAACFAFKRRKSPD